MAKYIWSDYVGLKEDIRHSDRGKEIYSLQSWVKLKFAAMSLKKIAKLGVGMPNISALFFEYFTNIEN